MTNIKISVGKCYILRNGLTTNPVRKSDNGTSYKFSAEVYTHEHKNPSIFDWKINGRYLHDGINSPYDIVKLLGNEN